MFVIQLVRRKVDTMVSYILRELLNIIAEIENELRTCIFYAVVNNKLQGDVPSFSLGTSPPNVFNPINETYRGLHLYNQINLYKRYVLSI